MDFALVIGLFAGLTLCMHAFKLGVKRILGYDVWMDIILAAGLYEAFAGTAMGVSAAIIGGFTSSVILFTVKQFIGFQRLGFIRVSRDVLRIGPIPPVTVYYSKLVWKTYPPRFGKHSKGYTYGVPLLHPLELEEHAKEAQRRAKQFKPRWKLFG